MLRDRGHSVEVFCGSTTRIASEEYEGITVHRVLSMQNTFRERVLEVFKSRHEQHPFDLMESPEYMGDGLVIKQAYPALPLVVKLHSPESLLRELMTFYDAPPPLLRRLRYLAVAALRGKLDHQYWKWTRKEDDVEYRLCTLADQIHTPSISLGQIVVARWGVDKTKIHHVPYPFIPNEKFLAIPTDTNSQTFTYMGRLEVRKGIIALVDAAKLIFAALPKARFMLVGADQSSHIPGLSMRNFVEQQLAQHLDKVSFLEVQKEGVPAVLAQTDVCVYPSLWENFPNVCLEAMSAGRAVVGSIEGGMRDMLESPEAGLLVQPTNVQQIADAVITLLRDQPLREKLGKAARNKVLTDYNSAVIGELVEAKYGEVIKKN